MNAVDVNPKLVAYYNLPVDKGVLVTNVVQGSEADKSGLGRGDILVRMDDVDINNVRDLVKVINKHNVGDSVPLTIFRENQKAALETVLEKASSPQLPKGKGRR